MATTEAMQILECIKDTPGWLQMRDAMKREKKATWQQILAFHTWPTVCQPHKASGLVESLEEAGLRHPLTDPGSGMITVQLIFPKLFIVEIDWDYTSAWHDSHAQAKEAACFDTLCTFLMLAPHLVRLHPNSLKRGSYSVKTLRMGQLRPGNCHNGGWLQGRLCHTPCGARDSRRPQRLTEPGSLSARDSIFQGSLGACNTIILCSTGSSSSASSTSLPV